MTVLVSVQLIMQGSIQKNRRKPFNNRPRSRSNNSNIPNTQITNSQSKKSLTPPQCKPCQSHSFIFKPLQPHSYFSESVKFNYTHQQKHSKPYPIIFKEFLKKQYLPFFGLEHHMPTYRKSDLKYKQSFYEQKVKETTQQKEHRTINSPVPKHNYCQICKKQFQIYLIHINERNHIQMRRKGFGETCINELIEDMQRAQENEQQDRRMELITGFRKDLQAVIPVFHQKYRLFMKEYQSLCASK